MRTRNLLPVKLYMSCGENSFIYQHNAYNSFTTTIDEPLIIIFIPPPTLNARLDWCIGTAIDSTAIVDHIEFNTNFNNNNNNELNKNKQHKPLELAVIFFFFFIILFLPSSTLSFHLSLSLSLHTCAAKSNYPLFKMNTVQIHEEIFP